MVCGLFAPRGRGDGKWGGGWHGVCGLGEDIASHIVVIPVRGTMPFYRFLAMLANLS